MSSAASGKTAFLERTLRELRTDCTVAALVGDLATANDAARLARSGARVEQITTSTVCHLDADMVDCALHGWRLDALDILFIANVGNLVCLASYDLVESLRLECDLPALDRNIQNVHPGMEIFEVSSKSGAGMDTWLQFVLSLAANSPGRTVKGAIPESV